MVVLAGCSGEATVGAEGSSVAAPSSNDAAPTEPDVTSEIDQSSAALPRLSTTAPTALDADPSWSVQADGDVQVAGTPGVVAVLSDSPNSESLWGSEAQPRQLAAYDPTTSETLWSIELSPGQGRVVPGVSLTSDGTGPGGTEGGLFFATTTVYTKQSGLDPERYRVDLVAFDARSGGEAWRTTLVTAREVQAQLDGTTEDNIITTVKADPTHVVVATSRALLGFDTQTGDPLWRQPLKVKGYGLNMGWLSVDLNATAVAAIAQEGDRERLLVLDPSTGAALWQHARPADLSQQLPSMYHVEISDDRVFVQTARSAGLLASAMNGGVTAYQATTGTEVWSTPVGAASSSHFVIDEKAAMIIHPTGTFKSGPPFALRTSDGSLAWKSQGIGRIAASAPAATDGHSYLLTAQDLIVLNDTNGKTRATLSLDNISSLNEPPLPLAGMIIVNTGEGLLGYS